MQRKITILNHASETKNNILAVSSHLFASKGFEAVSIRDIAKAAGIKSSSIYNHYINKDALLEDVLLQCELSYRNYFDWLTNENQTATSLEQVIDNMFRELMVAHDATLYAGIVVVLREQFNNTVARNLVFKLFYDDSINFIQADFDKLIAKNIMPPSNTKAIATVFMHSVLHILELRMHQSMAHGIPFDLTNMLNNLKQLITAMLKQEVK